MKIKTSARLAGLGKYAFAEVDRLVSELRAKGVDPIDFGVGDPRIPTPEIAREALKRAADERACSGYPPYDGLPEFREAVAAWMGRRFGVKLDPSTDISSTIGSKEAVFNFAEAFVDPGDVVLIPTPGYPPYSRGTRFAEGEPYFYPLTASNGFLPELESIPREVLRRAKVLWINYPNSPSGATAPPSFLRRAAEFGRKNGILVASDEAYTEIYFGREPRSILEFGKENVLAFHSMSKRSAMTGYRIGWVAGDPEAVAAFKKIKTNIDSGTPMFIQDAAIAALADETHVAAMRAEYRIRRDLMTDAFSRLGLDKCVPDATLYIWQKVPMESAEFCKRLLSPEIAVVATPGDWISDLTGDGLNPGAGYVRFALVADTDQVRVAADRIGSMKLV